MSRPKLPLPLEELVDQSRPARAQQMWGRIQARAHARQGRRRALLLLLAAAFTSIAIAALWQRDARWFGPAAGPLLRADGRPLPTHIEPSAGYAALDLDDGSRVTVARHARLDVLETSGRAVSLALRSGRARFDVRPRGPRTWRIDCGPLAVEVVGTAFVLERTPAALQIEVLHGAVLVRGESVPDGVQRLNDGQALRVETGGLAEPAPPSPPQAGEPVVSEAAVESEAVQALPPAPGTASAAARSAGGISAARVRAREVDIEAALREADALRLAGRPAAAVEPLTRVVEAQPRDARAGLAAFALARLHLGALADPAQAARDLERALSLGLPAALHEDALAKLAQARARAGEGEAACEVYERYTQRFPDGTKLRALQRRCQVDPAP
jgi:transmembrane sensor